MFADVRSEPDLIEVLGDALYVAADGDGEVITTRTFSEACLLTRDDGLVLKLENGAEFQLTVVMSRPPSE